MTKGGGVDVSNALTNMQNQGRDQPIDAHHTDASMGTSTLLDCIKEGGGFNVPKVLKHQQDQHYAQSLAMSALWDSDSDNSSVMEEPAPKKTRQKRSSLLELRGLDGIRRPATPFDMPWYKMYVLEPMLDKKKFHKKFRNRFRQPYSEYVQFVKDAKEGRWFPRWMQCNSTAPLELLILGAFRYLGRGWTFDDLEEATAISAEVHRNFFHQFVHVGRTILYDLHVVTPRTTEDSLTHQHEFNMTGFHGCIGSSDATHISVEKCAYRLRNNHLGGKQHLTTRTFNLTVNHRRRILSSTVGYPGRWNDKTLVLFDDFVRGIHEGTKIGRAHV